MKKGIDNYKIKVNFVGKIFEIGIDTTCILIFEEPKVIDKSNSDRIFENWKPIAILISRIIKSIPKRIEEIREWLSRIDFVTEKLVCSFGLKLLELLEITVKISFERKKAKIKTYRIITRYWIQDLINEERKIKLVNWFNENFPDKPINEIEF